MRTCAHRHYQLMYTIHTVPIRGNKTSMIWWYNIENIKMTMRRYIRNHMKHILTHMLHFGLIFLALIPTACIMGSSMQAHSMHIRHGSQHVMVIYLQTSSLLCLVDCSASAAQPTRYNYKLHWYALTRNKDEICIRVHVKTNYSC